MLKRIAPLVFVAVGTLYADLITPSSFSTTIAVGGTATVNKTVTIEQSLTTALDIFFLTDTTGSMGGSIANVQSGFSSVVTSIAGVATNVQYGAGQYKDVGSSLIYQTNQNLTSSTAAVQTAINGWSASGGGDLPEANLFALEEAANTVSWRSGSIRFLVWTGDAPGHDPRNGSTEKSATDALVAKNVEVIAASATSGPGIDQTGQATRIANATGGTFLGTLDPTEISDRIEDAITGELSEYSVVELDVVGLMPGLQVTWDPLSYKGAFDRSIDRDFGFDVTFKGVTAGTYTFQTVAKVDGRIVATENDRIIVGDGGGGVIPEPSSFILMTAGLAALIIGGRASARSGL